jgi:hypothetical protein
MLGERVFRAKASSYLWWLPGVKLMEAMAFRLTLAAKMRPGVKRGRVGRRPRVKLFDVVGIAPYGVVTQVDKGGPLRAPIFLPLEVNADRERVALLMSPCQSTRKDFRRRIPNVVWRLQIALEKEQNHRIGWVSLSDISLAPMCMPDE